MKDKIFTDIPGVYATGIHSGIKAKKKDLALFYVPGAVASAGVFTQNRLTASSVQITKKNLKQSVLKAVIVNSGNANAGTGKNGFNNSKLIVKQVAKELGLKQAEVGIASTGVIGVQLPMDAVLSGIEKITKDPLKTDGFEASEAIMTTDLVSKTAYISKVVGGKEIIVSGTTKGSGMIEPNMATTLSFMFTNVKLSQVRLQSLFSKAMNASFNMISVDSDTSTNDLALIQATGEVPLKKDEEQIFYEVLLEASVSLAKQIAIDGEGATKLIECHVSQAKTLTDARRVAKQVINSPLVKTAIYGNDPNWGRIVAAACKSPDVNIFPETLRLSIANVTIFEKGEPCTLTTAQRKKMFDSKTISICLELGQGNEAATAWGCDLTENYIKINTAYT